MSPIIKAVPLLHPCDASLAEKLHRIARLRSSNAKKCMKRLPGLDGVEGERGSPKYVQMKFCAVIASALPAWHSHQD